MRDSKRSQFRLLQSYKPLAYAIQRDHFSQLRERVSVSVKPVGDKAWTMRRAHGIVSQDSGIASVGLERRRVVFGDSSQCLEWRYPNLRSPMHWPCQIPNGMSTTASLAGDGPVRRQHFAMLYRFHDPIERVRPVHVQNDARPGIASSQLNLRKAPRLARRNTKRCAVRPATGLSLAHQWVAMGLFQTMLPDFCRCIVNAKKVLFVSVFFWYDLVCIEQPPIALLLPPPPLKPLQREG